jgi:hypothetical protein
MTDRNEDLLFSRLPWTAAKSASKEGLWEASVDIAPGNPVVLHRPAISLREANKQFDAIKDSLDKISMRLTEQLASGWRNEREDDDEDEDWDGEAEVGAAAAAPPLPLDIAQPKMALRSITFASGRKATLYFNVLLFGRVFIMSIPSDFALSPHATVSVCVEDDTLGRFELVHPEGSRWGAFFRPAYAAYFTPRGYFWESRSLKLSPLPSVEERGGYARFRDAIEAMPTLLERAKSSATRDPAKLPPTIVDYLLNDVDGPWHYYDSTYHGYEEEQGVEGKAERRRRDLYDILKFSGLPEVLLFADGSALVSCAHRTSRKSDVFVIELTMSSQGQFEECEVNQVYWGE